MNEEKKNIYTQRETRTLCVLKVTTSCIVGDESAAEDEPACHAGMVWPLYVQELRRFAYGEMRVSLEQSPNICKSGIVVGPFGIIEKN
jgi:hypothetical protein